MESHDFSDHEEATVNDYLNQDQAGINRADYKNKYHFRQNEEHLVHFTDSYTKKSSLKSLP